MLDAEALQPVTIAVLTVSDTRTLETDRSGNELATLLGSAGHHLLERRLCADDKYAIRAVVSQWIAQEAVQVIIVTGGTGITARDITPEALQPLFDKDIPGFGELFRSVSFTEIGTSTVQSRAIAGVANGTLIFALPGSTHACRTAWNHILAAQLDNRLRPCNFVELLPRLRPARD